MTADKIFLVKPLCASEQDAPFISDVELPHYLNTCYIRKDALLDYFHQRVEELNSPLNGVFGSTEREHCYERISELLLLVDKLNEM